MTTPSVSLLGLGRMGEPIARRLLRDLDSLTVWNRTAAKADRLVAEGARLAATPADAAAPITLTVLTDLDDVEALLDGPDGLLVGWARAAISSPILVVHGTVSPLALRGLHARLADVGVSVIDAPLSGGVAGAESGALSVMVGGDTEAIERAQHILERVGRTVVIAGGPGAGEIVKACNQVVVAATLTALSEAIVLAEGYGVDRAALLTVLNGGLAASEVLAQKRERWLADDYEGGGSAANQLKDLRFVATLAAHAHLTLPVADAIREAFEETVQHERGSLDHSAVLLTVSERAAAQTDGARRLTL
ncbi:NAD(P)-dependent oxidoreductase [Microbacterium laevaniformans]|uniref:NAD(P)-dependent oxidoreductase n=1 Tax=Microbacterium laevaniformans TaxID=36807 RepID=UPI0025E2D584|nr:NAD(P)-dependent oxidoreductase [uncultured Microbacterium sp.]